MKKQITGIVLGVIAGIIDLIPMILQNLSWDANISAFTMWLVIGFILASVEIELNPILKGILIAFLVLLPSAIIIGWHEPTTLIPIAIMTTILGGSLGFSIDKITKNQ